MSTRKKTYNDGTCPEAVIVAACKGEPYPMELAEEKDADIVAIRENKALPSLEPTAPLADEVWACMNDLRDCITSP